MQLNTNLPLAGQQPNVLAAFAGGQEAAQQQLTRQNENALNAYVQQNAGGIMGGDQNALAGMAGLGTQGLNAAMGVQGAQLDQQNVRGAMQDREARLQLAYEQSSLQAQQIMQTMTQAEREAELQELDRALSAATQIQDEPTWQRIMTEMGQPDLAGRFADRDVLIAGALATKDALTMGQGPTPTSGIQEYEFARQQGFTGTFEDWKASGRAQTNINIDSGPRLGSLSTDFDYLRDAEGNPMRGEDGRLQAAPVIGSPADLAQREAAAAQVASDRNASDYARTVTQDIGIAMDFLTKLGPISGSDNMVGANARLARSGIPGTPEYNMKGFVESALSNLTLDTMNRMRESSPSGATGMGNMSDNQLRVITGILGQWDAGLPIETQQFILGRLGNFYLDVQVGTQRERAEAVADGRMTAEENEQIQQMYWPDDRDMIGRPAGQGEQPAQPAQPQQDAPAAQGEMPRVATDADYDALPSGATFIDPDGITRRKP